MMTVLWILCLFNRNQVSYSVLLPPKFYSTILCLTKGIQILKVCLAAQSCPTLWDPMGCSPPGSFVRGDSPGQESSSRGSSQPRGRTQVSHTAGAFFTVWATGKPMNTGVGSQSLLQGSFLTQESNQRFPHCRWILYQLSYQGSPKFKIVYRQRSFSLYHFAISLNRHLFSSNQRHFINLQS